MKQSSIEWLEQRIKEMFLPLSKEESLLKDIEEAKEMDRTHKINSLKEAYSMGRLNKSIKEFNETFNLEERD